MAFEKRNWHPYAASRGGMGICTYITSDLPAVYEADNYFDSIADELKDMKYPLMFIRNTATTGTNHGGTRIFAPRLDGGHIKKNDVAVSFTS